MTPAALRSVKGVVFVLRLFSHWTHTLSDRINPKTQAIGTSSFMLALWRCLLLCPQVRLAAVNYLAVTIPKQPQALAK